MRKPKDEETKKNMKLAQNTPKMKEIQRRPRLEEDKKKLV